MTPSLGQHVLTLVTLTLLSTVTRLYRVAEPKHVCWDETHFGKMATWYMNNTFFFDVHPPLGKLMIAYFGAVTGYEANFAFDKPGDMYGSVHYLGMRVWCSLFGALLVPLAYLLVFELTSAYTAAVIASVAVLLDVGFITISQYILLDPLLLAAIALGAFFFAKFQSHYQKGLFQSAVLRQVAARALGLILLPLLLYVGVFHIHFTLLYKSGPGDGFFSSAFQSQLQGNPLHNASMPTEVAYGSVVTLKNHRVAGAYLHSHPHLYPEGVGARQQQVTTYSHKDDNNLWVVKRYDVTPDVNDSVEVVRHGDMIRLEHLLSGRNLHSHRVTAPLTKRHFQVTGYGEDGQGDLNDIWRVEIEGARDQQEHLAAVRGVFRLVHVSTGCALHSHSRQLPKWGWEQLEVTCNPVVGEGRNRWNVEEVRDQRLPNRSIGSFSQSFWEKFIESHAVMFQGNSGLKPKEDEVTSQPWQWPINLKGQPFSGPDYRVYLLGNPVIWWASLATNVLFVITYLLWRVVEHRAGQAHKLGTSSVSLRACAWLWVAWFLHYAPFWFMGRILYFHHYFPAVYFNMLLAIIYMEYVLRLLCSLIKSSPSSQWLFYYGSLGTVVAALVYSFLLFSPLSYGMTGPLADDPRSRMYGLKWLPTWDM